MTMPLAMYGRTEHAHQREPSSSWVLLRVICDSNISYIYYKKHVYLWDRSKLRVLLRIMRDSIISHSWHKRHLHRWDRSKFGMLLRVFCNSTIKASPLMRSFQTRYGLPRHAWQYRQPCITQKMYSPVRLTERTGRFRVHFRIICESTIRHEPPKQLFLPVRCSCS